MDHQLIQEKCELFLKDLGVPGFIVFGWQTDGKVDSEFRVVSSYHNIQPNAAIKGLSWALNDIIGKAL